MSVTLTGTVTIAGTDPDEMEGGTITITSSDGRTKVYTFATDAASGNPTQGSGNVVNVRIGGDSAAAVIASRLQDAIENTIGHGKILTVTRAGAVLTIVEESAPGNIRAASIAEDAGDHASRTNFTVSGKVTEQVPFVLGEYGTIRLRAPVYPGQ